MSDTYTRPLPNADKHIASTENAVFRSLRDCLQTKGIRKHGMFLIFGQRAVRDSLTLYPERARDLIFSEDYRNDEALNALVGKTKGSSKLSTIHLTGPLFRELDIFSTRQPILAVRPPELEMADLEKAPKGLEILCALGDPANVGALLRSAAAFGASRVILLQESASPFHPKAVRAASAATLATPLLRGPSISKLPESKHPLIGLDLKGEDLSTFTWPKNCRLILGEEGLGLPDRADFHRVSIPIASQVESLNATAAASIAMFTYRSQENHNA